MPGFDARLVDDLGLVVGEEEEVESVGVAGAAEQSGRSGSTAGLDLCSAGVLSRTPLTSRDSDFTKREVRVMMPLGSLLHWLLLLAFFNLIVTFSLHR